jgi:Domain of unknown function (DUF6268)
MLKFIFSGLFIIYSIALQAQSYIDVLKLNANTTPLNTFDSSSSSTRINELSLDLSLPIKLNKKFALITGVIYENINTKLFEKAGYNHFGSIGLKLGFNKTVNDTWSYSIVMLPKLASDFGMLQSEDFQMGAIGIVKYTKNANINYKVALYANKDLFGPFFVPMIGFYYLSSDNKWESNVMAPLQADVNYKATSTLTVGINYVGQIRSYLINNNLPVLGNYYVSKASNELSSYIKFYFNNTLSLQTKIGYSIGRSYRIYDIKDKVNFAIPLYYANDKRQQLNSDFADGLLLQLSLIYRVKL